MKKFFQKIGNYIKESYNELVYKVSWPTRAELTSSAVVVLSASLILALVIFAIDLSFEWIVSHFYGMIFKP
jgi:preprotein translocase subunit SecE